MGVGEQATGGNSEEGSLDFRITQDEVVRIIAYGIKLRNSLHTYVFEGIGYEKSAALVKAVVSEYLRQIDDFIETEEESVPGDIRSESTGASEEAIAAAQTRGGRRKSAGP